MNTILNMDFKCLEKELNRYNKIFYMSNNIIRQILSFLIHFFETRLINGKKYANSLLIVKYLYIIIIESGNVHLDYFVPIFKC